MSEALRSDHIVTIAEFDAFLAGQPDDGTIWELVGGEILAMTNPNANHGQIALNIGVALKSAAEGAGCRVNIGGMRVQAADEGSNKTLPDLVVNCGVWDGTRNAITDPVTVFEILSPSTMDYDRGPKLDFYKSLDSTVDIVIVYQDQVRVEHYRREAEGWSMVALTAPAARLTLVGVGFSQSLDAIYAGTDIGAD